MSYSNDKKLLLLDLLASGQSLNRICKLDGMPTTGTVFNWLESDKEFLDKYVRAREAQASVYAQEIIDIADSLPDALHWVDAQGQEYTDSEVSDMLKEDRQALGLHKVGLSNELVAKARLQVDARKWYAAKVAPTKYGDSSTLNLGNKDGEPLKTEHVFKWLDEDEG